MLRDRGAGSTRVFCGNRGLRREGNFHFPSGLESNLVAILIGQGVFDAKLSLQVIGTMNGDLGFLR